MELSHDPSARLPYGFDWSAWLDSDDSIASADLTVSVRSGTGSPSDLTIGAPQVGRAVVKSVVSGGLAGTVYRITCHIVTANGLEEDRSLILRCRDR